jgi:hypothetical protein
MTKAYRLRTRKQNLPDKPFPLNFLLGCAQKSLEDFELARLAEIADLRKEIQSLMGRFHDAMMQAALAHWFRSQDRQRLKDAIDNEESPIEYAKRMIREGQRSAAELSIDELLPMPPLEPGAAHLAAALRYQERNMAEGKCSLCPKPLAHHSVRYCDEHLEKARIRDRQKKGLSEPGSREYLYSGEITDTKHGRQPGTLTSLATSREQKTRALLAELGIPPENAAITLDAAKEALLKVMPKTRKEATTREQLQDAAVVPTKNTCVKALNQLLALGKIQRIGEGWKGSPYRYFAGDCAKQ